jgi:WD40 repeat protein
MAATGSEDGSIRLWQFRDGRPLARLEGHAAGIRALAFVGDELVSASDDGTLRRWRAAPHAVASLGPLASEPVTMEIAPDARRLIVGGRDGGIVVYGLDGARLAALEGHRGAVFTAVLDAAGGAVTAAEDATVRFWRGSREAARIEVANLSAAAVAPAGDRVVTGTDRGVIALWDVRTRTKVWSFELGDPIARFELSPRGDRLFAVTRAGALHLFVLEATRGERYAMVPDQELLHATFASHGGLITASGDRARIFDPAGRLVHELRGHTGRVISARFDASGERAVTAGQDGTVRLWSASRGTELRRFDGHRGLVADAWLDARELLWSVGNDGTLRAWDPSSGRLLSTFVHHRGSCYGMQVAGNAAVIATWAADGIVVREPSLGRVDLARARGGPGPGPAD